MKAIRIEIGAGELFDRWTILEIKARHARADEQRQRIRREMDRLAGAAAGLALGAATVDADLAELRDVNGRIWAAEDQLRACELRRAFGSRFVELARSIYKLNDRRALIKRRIDDRHGSETREEKMYATDREGPGP